MESVQFILTNSKFKFNMGPTMQLESTLKKSGVVFSMVARYYTHESKVQL